MTVLLKNIVIAPLMIMILMLLSCDIHSGLSDGSGGGLPGGEQITADHRAAAAFNSIPESYINAAKNNLHIAYGKTSHGSQVTSGMTALSIWNSSLYAWNNGGSGGALDLRCDMGDYDMPYGAADLGNPDRTAWASATRAYLADNPDINVIIWSWCYQVEGASEEDINTYLSLMNQLETDYPSIYFIYMTGHLNGSGAEGNLNVRNEQIRAYCTANNKVLYDFADIESFDPGGTTNFMTLNGNEDCDYTSGNWAEEWVDDNPGHVLTTLTNTYCDSCAHSDSPSEAKLNCVLKGRAAWWLWARLAGWDGN